MKDTIIYLRTSTEEQNPENQLKDCEKLALKLELKDYDVISEQISGWKDTEREGFDKLKIAIENNQIRNVIVWDLDRLYRNRKKLIALFELCRINRCRIYSFRQDWLEAINKIPSPFNEIMSGLMIQIMGWLSEEESTKKSERIKISVRRESGTTKSYKGKVWGRPNINESTIKEIIEHFKRNESYTQICNEVFYWDKNNNKKFVSKGLVHKTISKFVHNNKSL